MVCGSHKIISISALKTIYIPSKSICWSALQDVVCNLASSLKPSMDPKMTPMTSSSSRAWHMSPAKNKSKMSNALAMSTSMSYDEMSFKAQPPDLRTIFDFWFDFLLPAGFLFTLKQEYVFLANHIGGRQCKFYCCETVD